MVSAETDNSVLSRIQRTRFFRMQIAYFTIILSGVFLIVMGILVKHLKMYGLVSGFDQLTDEQKSGPEIENYATAFRNVMIFIGLSLIISAVVPAINIIESESVNNGIMVVTPLVAMAIGLPILLIKGYRLKNK